MEILHFIQNKRMADEIGAKTKNPASENESRIWGVVMDGIEPPTQGFSVLCSTD